jgi:hypothetical protein
MTRGGVDGLRHARRRPIALAIAWRTQEGAALHDFAGQAGTVHADFPALVLSTTTRIFHGAAGTVNDSVVLIPVRRPLPYIAGHVVEAVAIGRI